MAQGKVESVKEYLGSNYIVEGIVIEGKQIGRTMGFPTANLKFKENLILPRIGIYATKVYIGDKVYIGATNIGFNPTVRVEKLSIETLSNEAKIVYNQLNKPIFYPDEINNTSLVPGDILSALTELEIEGLIRSLPGGRYELIKN